MATTEILPFATAGGANVMSQADYAALAARTAGFAVGPADPEQLNKVWRQSAFVAAGIANWLVSQGVSVPDDGNVSALVTKIQTGLVAAIDAEIGAIAGMRFKGVIDCSGNPNYPAATAGDVYVVSVAGKIGGASGVVVNASDTVICKTTNAGGTQAAVGISWVVVEGNLGYTPEDVANKATSTSLGTSDTLYPSQNAVKTYADTKVPQTRTVNGHALSANVTVTAADVGAPSGSGTSSGTNTGDQTSVSGNAGTATALATARAIDGQNFDGTAAITVIAPGTHAATGKTTPVDADEMPLVDSAASNVLKKVTWANIKATIFAAWGTLISTATGKTTPVNADAIAIMDSAASNATKSLTFTNLKAFLKTYFDTLYAAVGGGSGYVYLGTFSVAAGIIKCEGFTSSAYDVYDFEIINAVPSNNGQALGFRVGTGGTPTYDSGNNYSFIQENVDQTPTQSFWNNGGTSYIEICQAGVGCSSDSTKGGFSGCLTLTNPLSATQYKDINLKGVFWGANGSQINQDGSAIYMSATAVTALEMAANGFANNLASGKIEVWGKKNS